MHRLPAPLVIALAIVTLAAAPACSGGGSASPTAAPAGAATVDATASVAASPAAQGSPTPAIAAAVLATSDLPAGWVGGRLQQPQITTNACDATFDTLASKGRWRAVFINGQAGLFESVAAYAPGDAQRAVEQVRSAFASCQQWSRVLNNNRLATYTWSKLDNVAPPADETLAYTVHIAITPPRSEGTDEFVVVRRGNVVMIFSHLTAGAGDAAATKALIEKADRKVAAVAGSY
ncbi:MAG: hypothetical protein KGK07_03500 [Chloroflexota bacterium]|nr:hypothetical protein [Chloroflexota bacterium]